MKRFTILAAAAVVAGGASAQYTCDPVVEKVLEKGKVTDVIAIQLNAEAQGKLEAQGAKITSAAPDGAANNLYVWEGTLAGVEVPPYPGVGMQTDGYPSFTVTDKGWSGAGYAVGSVNTEWWNENTHFHLAYMSDGNAPASVAIIVADGGDIQSAPAKVALGDPFNDNGAIYPAIAPKSADDWQGIDITFADLKKLYPAFDWKAVKEWKGNIMSFLAGGVTGSAIAFDAIYFYQLGDGNGVSAVAEDAQWIVTDNTINVAGANGIALYNMNGQLVKQTAGTTLGTDNLAKGVYVAKSGKAVRKLIVK